MNVPQCLPLFSPRPPAAGGGGRWPRLQICSEARKSVPLEPISPIRNALRPRHLPAAAALRVACSRGWGSEEGSAASARHNTAGSAALAPDCSGQEDRARGVSHASPPPARPTERQRRGQAGDAEPARGLTPGPPRPRAEHEQGRLSRGISESISVPGRGARVAAGAPRVGNWSRPCPLAPGRSFPPYSPVPSTPQGDAGRRAAGEQAHLLAAAAAKGSTEEGSSDPPRRLSAGAGGTERRGPDCRFPGLLLRSSVLTAVPGNQRRNCHSPPPSAPAVSAPSSHSFLPPPPRPCAPPACLASWRHAHPARRGRLWDAAVRSLVFAPRTPGSSPPATRAAGSVAPPACLPARGYQRPFLPIIPQDFPEAGRAVGQVSPPRTGGSGWRCREMLDLRSPAFGVSHAIIHSFVFSRFTC